jgi:Zn-dependent protease
MNPTFDSTDPFQALYSQVQQVMDVEDVTRGDRQGAFVVRYRGRLRGPSSEAYDRLQPEFERAGMTLLFREADGRHVVAGVPRLPEPGPSDRRVNVALFVVTLLCVLATGVLFSNVTTYDLSTLQPDLSQPGQVLTFILGGVPFALALMGILLAHEFGHYLAARHHKAAVTLPYFLPLPPPLSTLGTLGAFIRLKSPPKDRRQLLDIGLAGPLAGFVVGVPILLVGIFLSQVQPLPASASAGSGLMMEGNSILYLGAKFLLKGELLPAPASYGGVAPVLYWIRYVLSGTPFPFGGHDIIIHPLAWAGWAGMLVTAPPKKTPPPGWGGWGGDAGDGLEPAACRPA